MLYEIVQVTVARFCEVVFVDRNRCVRIRLVGNEVSKAEVERFGIHVPQGVPNEVEPVLGCGSVGNSSVLDADGIVPQCLERVVLHDDRVPVVEIDAIALHGSDVVVGQFNHRSRVDVDALIVDIRDTEMKMRKKSINYLFLLFSSSLQNRLKNMSLDFNRFYWYLTLELYFVAIISFFLFTTFPIPIKANIPYFQVPNCARFSCIDANFVGRSIPFSTSIR